MAATTSQVQPQPPETKVVASAPALRPKDAVDALVYLGLELVTFCLYAVLRDGTWLLGGLPLSGVPLRRKAGI